MKVLRFRSLAVIAVCAAVGLYGWKIWRQQYVLERIIERLSADSRVAEVVVTEASSGDASGQEVTTIKFVEYDSTGKALAPRYFSFHSNVIQFQAMVVRFDDFLVRTGDRLKGKSAFIFLKAFSLQPPDVEQCEINRPLEVPTGYIVDGASRFERGLWKKFWIYALSSGTGSGVKNAQFEAPGTKFVPGRIYTIRIEHDGGLRIDSAPLPAILRGETLPS